MSQAFSSDVADWQEHNLFEDVFPEPENVFAGVKAVYGPMREHFLGFGSGSVRAAATKAETHPWIICVAASKANDKENVGRVLNLVELTQIYGPTTAFVTTEEERRPYERWPMSIACNNIYEVVNRPHVMMDLALENNPNIQVYDKLAPLTPERRPLLARLRGQPLRLADLPPLPHYIDPGKLQPVGYQLPSNVSAAEGKEIMKQCRQFERSSKMAKAKKALNRDANNGVHVCEGCGFSHESTALFDAHHLRPLALRSATRTTPSHLRVFCPTCHRIVHQMAQVSYKPLDLPELKAWWSRHGA